MINPQAKDGATCGESMQAVGPAPHGARSAPVAGNMRMRMWTSIKSTHRRARKSSGLLDTNLQLLPKRPNAGLPTGARPSSWLWERFQAKRRRETAWPSRRRLPPIDYVPRPARSLFRRMLLCSVSILKGPALIWTWTVYSSASSEGTRHEYRQVKPHPYSNCPSATTSSPAEIVNFGLPGRFPLTAMLVQASPADPTSVSPSDTWLVPCRY